MGKQPVIEQIWESWEWLLRDKLEGANNIVRLIYKEATQSGKLKPAEYERFMKQKLGQMLMEIGDAK